MMTTTTNHPSAELVLATYNARYTHASLGLRWLLANLGPNPPRTAWHEFDLRTPTAVALERIMAHQPRLVALGVYIWNAQRTTELLHRLRAACPGLIIVLGGPEVSARPETFPGFAQADLVITGEADACFGEWCRRLLAGERPSDKVIQAPPPDCARLMLPYHLYSADDLRHRHIHVETVRGCPFHCDFCTSGDAASVRSFPLTATLEALCALAERGAKTLRFVDRTFNARPEQAVRILETLRPWADKGLRLHLEFTPQRRYRADLGNALCSWPADALHIEVGIQTFNADVARRVNRPGIHQAEPALRFLLETARAEVHADLIVGLPGEDETSIAAGFDRLVRLQPHEIQVGLLKNLPGTALERHIDRWGLLFDPHPPYALQSSGLLSAEAVERLTRFAAFWDRLANTRRFPNTLPIILASHYSPFAAFMHLSEWLYAGFGRTHGIPLDDLCAALFAYLTYELRVPRETVRAALSSDFLADGNRPARSLPRCLRTDHGSQRTGTGA